METSATTRCTLRRRCLVARGELCGERRAALGIYVHEADARALPREGAHGQLDAHGLALLPAVLVEVSMETSAASSEQPTC